MKSNPQKAHDTEKAAKNGSKAQPTAASALAPATAVIADLFTALNKAKAVDTNKAAQPPESKKGDDEKRLRPTDNEDDDEVPADGLYHAPKPSVTLDDDDFFGPSAKKKRRLQKGAPEEDVQKESGGDSWCSRIISRKELAAMQRGGGKKKKISNAGNTPNCPFDCDCCF